MDESTIRGVRLLDLNDRGEPPRKKRIPHTVVAVEGYDTSLHVYFLKLALTKHFSSCGKVTHVYVPRDIKRGFILKSVAFVWITGEDCLDKALELSGTDVGGWIAIVKPAPSQPEFQDRAHRPIGKPPLTVRVTGFDSRLPQIDLQMALCKHFSSCGEVNRLVVLPSSAFIDLLGGKKSVDKALGLSGSNMGGMNLVVEPHPRSSEPNGSNMGEMNHIARRKRLDRAPVGYTLLSTLLMVSEETKKEIEMAMDKKEKKNLKRELMFVDEQIKKKM